VCRNQFWAFVIGAVVISLGAVVTAQAAPRYPACAEIRASCKQAGFMRGHAKTGEGIFVDCIAPIMRGTSQPRRASKPLPQINPQLVADCKAQNPNFGQRKRNPPPSQATEPPAQANTPIPRS
jgi:hypothetical protein